MSVTPPPSKTHLFPPNPSLVMLFSSSLFLVMVVLHQWCYCALYWLFAALLRYFQSLVSLHWIWLRAEYILRQHDYKVLILSWNVKVTTQGSLFIHNISKVDGLCSFLLYIVLVKVVLTGWVNKLHTCLYSYVCLAFYLLLEYKFKFVFFHGVLLWRHNSYDSILLSLDSNRHVPYTSYHIQPIYDSFQVYCSRWLWYRICCTSWQPAKSVFLPWNVAICISPWRLCTFTHKLK